jgi:hypothetical protein
MSLAERTLAHYKRTLARVGEDIIIRRYTSLGAAHTDIVTRARIMGYAPDELVGTIVQGDRKVIALTESLSALLPITTNDKVVVRGKELTIKAADDSTRRVNGVLIALELQVKG